MEFQKRLVKSKSSVTQYYMVEYGKEASAVKIRLVGPAVLARWLLQNSMLHEVSAVKIKLIGPAVLELCKITGSTC